MSDLEKQRNKETNSLEFSLLPGRMNEAQGTVLGGDAGEVCGSIGLIPFASEVSFPMWPSCPGCLHMCEFSCPHFRSLGKWPWLLCLRNGSVSHALILVKKKKPFEILHPWEVLRLHFWILSVGNITMELCLSVPSDCVAGIMNAVGWALGKVRILSWANTSLKGCWIFTKNRKVGDEIFIGILTLSWSCRVAGTFCRTATQKGTLQVPPSGSLCLQLVFARQSLWMKDGAI